MSLETAIWLVGVLLEAGLCALLCYRRIWRTLPIFFAYCFWDLGSNLLVYLAFHKISLHHYLTVYLVQTVIDSVLVLCVLAEIVRSLFSPLGRSVARRAVFGFGILILCTGSIAWWLAEIPLTGKVLNQLHWLLHLQQTTSIVRILFFLALALSARFLSIGFRDRELQIATGFGVYSLVSLGVEMAKSHAVTVSVLRPLNVLVVASYLVSLGYWVVCFARKDAPRSKFTPQMQNFLLAVAGSARQGRSTLSKQAEPHKDRDSEAR